MVPPRFAIIGTGRSGTGYMAELMRAHGFKCGHEHWWTLSSSPRRRKSGLDGDSSWLALPDIESGAWSGPVVLAVRDPVAVVRSLLGIRFFERGTKYTQFVYEQEPELKGLPALHAATEWWARWNERCAAVADLVVRVEDLPRQLDRVFDVV